MKKKQSLKETLASRASLASHGALQSLEPAFAAESRSNSARLCNPPCELLPVSINDQDERMALSLLKGALGSKAIQVAGKRADRMAMTATFVRSIGSLPDRGGSGSIAAIAMAAPGLAVIPSTATFSCS